MPVYTSRCSSWKRSNLIGITLHTHTQFKTLYLIHITAIAVSTLTIGLILNLNIDVWLYEPHRMLQHPALLQCMAQCSEVTPYLLVMEHCPMVCHCVSHSIRMNTLRLHSLYWAVNEEMLPLLVTVGYVLL